MLIISLYLGAPLFYMGFQMFDFHLHSFGSQYHVICSVKDLLWFCQLVGYCYTLNLLSFTEHL